MHFKKELVLFSLMASEKGVATGSRVLVFRASCSLDNDLDFGVILFLRTPCSQREAHDGI